MKSLFTLLATILYVAVASGRNVHDAEPANEDGDSVGLQEKPNRDHISGQIRHPRRKRQPFNGHNYRQDELFDNYNGYNNRLGRNDDYQPGYYYDRHYELGYKLGYESGYKSGYEYGNQKYNLARIMHLLENMQRPQTPPTPQPLQIILPMIYMMPQGSNGTIPFFHDRFADKCCPCPSESDDDGLDGARPINLKPIESNEPTIKTPPVEHGSSQAGATFTPPGRCKAAILVCCQDTSKEEIIYCFKSFNCSETYYGGRACHPAIFDKVIKEFTKAYAINT